MKLLEQIGRYLLSGGLAAIANYGGGEVLRLLAPATSGGVSVGFGQLVGTVVAFFLHRKYTFHVNDQAAGPQAVRFGIITVGAILLAYVVAELWMRAWVALGSPWVSTAVAASAGHVVAIGVNAVYGFIAMKLYALRDASPPGPATRAPGSSP